MRICAALLIPALGFSAAAANAAELQVAIVFDTGLTADRAGTNPFGRPQRVAELPDRARVEIDALEAALRHESPSLELALIACRSDDDAPRVRELDPSLEHLSALLEAWIKEGWCSPGPDLLEHAIESLAWKDGATKRILIMSEVGNFTFSGRTTAEEAVHRAERAGIVVHAIEFYPAYEGADRALSGVARDLHAFVDRPTAPLGRVPSMVRHASMLSGGSYFLAPSSTADPRRIDQRSFLFSIGKKKLAREPTKTYLDRVRATFPKAKLYAAGAAGSDALDDLAAGRRRPSEVRAEELPPQLQGLDLEPLLDAIWDYVDARRIAARVVSDAEQLLGSSPPAGGRLGADLAQALLQPRRLPPSRR